MNRNIVSPTIVVLCLALWLASSANAQQLMPADQLQAIRASLPILEDDDANALLHGDELILYDTATIPPAYQHQNGNGRTSATFHSPSYNISADPSDRNLPHGNGGNAGVEFPWKVGKPGGAHNSPAVQSIKGFYFPGPAAVFHRDVPGRVGTRNTTILLDWVFASGSVFVEVIYQRIKSQDVVFEVRTRSKVDDTWEFDVFRPFASAEDLASALEEMGEGKYRAAAIADLRANKSLPLMRLVDAFHSRKNAFDATSEVYQLPPIKTDDVLQLLDREFVSTFGMPFKAESHAPSNDTKYVNLVPPLYHGAFVSPTGTTGDCMSCHESAGHHATEFQNRGWYGRVPGSFTEKINSWHPVTPSSISYNGGSRTVRLRQDWVDAGLITYVRGQLPPGYKFTKVD